MAERLRAEFLYKFVGILSALHFEHTRLYSRFGEKVYPAGSRFLPCRVRVVGQYDLFFAHSAQQPRLRGSYRRSERRDRTVETRLVHRDHVHIAFAQNKIIRLGILGVIERKEHFPFLKHKRFVAVEIFRGHSVL